jgi:hypothetical protein
MNQLAFNFVTEFAKSHNLDPTRIISIELDVNKGIKYQYLDTYDVITVEELSKWAM